MSTVGLWACASCALAEKVVQKWCSSLAPHGSRASLLGVTTALAPAGSHTLLLVAHPRASLRAF